MRSSTTGQMPSRGPIGHWKSGRCQYDQSPRRWPLLLAVARVLVLGVRRTWWRRGVARGLGAPSVFKSGQVVRVKTRQDIAHMLDAGQRSRGLLFTESQWSFCGRTLVVDRVVRQMLDDHGVFRPISRAVILAGATCDAGGAGCGRSCGLLWKDEWLEPASSEDDADSAIVDGWANGPSGEIVRVRSFHELRARADVGGPVGGIALPLDAAGHAGEYAHIERRVHMPDRLPSGLPAPPVGDWFILRGVRCDGHELENPYPCDRRCALLWHQSWLEFDPERQSSDE